MVQNRTYNFHFWKSYNPLGLSTTKRLKMKRLIKAIEDEMHNRGYSIVKNNGKRYVFSDQNEEPIIFEDDEHFVKRNKDWFLGTYNRRHNNRRNIKHLRRY